MDKLFVYLFLIVFANCIILNGQKYDNTWLFGCCYSEGSRLNGGINITFNNNTIDTLFLKRNINFNRTSSSISKIDDGVLLLYTNGCEIYDNQDRMLKNGDNINPGENHSIYCENYGYNLPKGAVFLPVPNSKKLYFLIHRGYDDLSTNVNKLYYSKIDVGENGELGVVMEKNVLLIDEVMYKRHFDICKHANGRDYWIIAFNQKSDSVFRFLATPEGITKLNSQYFPIKRGLSDDISNSILSPNGKIGVRIDPFIGLSIMNFDRESGLFFNLKSFPFWENPLTSHITGIAVSSNSNYLYINTLTRLYQLDFKNPEFIDSKVLIDTFDYFGSPFYTTFYLEQLGPNEKIYLNCANGSKYLHVINKPNALGIKCNFQQHSFQLPAQNAFTMPYFPNYRLGPIDGSVSDSLGIDNIPVAEFRYDQDTINFKQFEFTNLSWYEPTEFWWDYGDGCPEYYTTVWDTSITHIFPTNGVYNVCLRAKNGNGENTICKTLKIGPTGNYEIQFENELEVFPNPTKDLLVINLKEYLPENMSYNMYNLNGDIVSKGRIYAGSNVIGIENINSGMYFLGISEKGKKVFSSKLIKL